MLEYKESRKAMRRVCKET